MMHTESMSDNVYIASRVHQLDAEVLDIEIESLFSSQLNRSLNLLQRLVPDVTSVQPELLLILRYYLFKHSLFAKNASLGQQLLGLRLVDSESHTSVPSSRLQWYGLVSIIGPYLQHRMSHILTHNKDLEVASDFIRLAQLINFVIFLTDGRFRCLSHRLMSMSCSLSGAAAIFNPVNYDFMSREVLWYTFYELLSFLLPLLNPVKIRNFFNRITMKSSPGLSMISPGIRCKSDLMTCAICEQSPVNTREIGCNHCFCYYCVMTAILSDQSYGFSCPKCNYHIRDVSQIRELYLKGF